jgi:hypothetical protein
MAVTTKVYGLLAKSMANGLVDFENHSLKAMLCTNVYVPNQDTHQFKNSISGEVVASGYAAGGLAINGRTINYNSVENLITVNASNLVWPSITMTGARYLVVYDDSYSTPATKPLILYVDFGANMDAAGQSFYYNWPSGVLIKFQVPA